MTSVQINGLWARRTEHTFEARPIRPKLRTLEMHSKPGNHTRHTSNEKTESDTERNKQIKKLVTADSIDNMDSFLDGP